MEEREKELKWKREMEEREEKIRRKEEIPRFEREREARYHSTKLE